jgi:hypothetical protein
MSWSYQDTMPRDIDKVRFYLGDTDSTDPLVTDEEIDFALSEGGSVRAAASLCSDRLAAQYARLADLSEGQLKISYSQRYKQFREIAASVKSYSRGRIISLPTAGGILVSDKDAAEADTNRVAPSFTVDILDNPNVGNLDTDHGTITSETE